MHKKGMKFRVWGKGYGEGWMGEGDFYFNYEGHCNGCMTDGDSYSNEELTIQYFTGLKDANGKDVYEGDIIEREDQWDMTERAAVEFIAPSFVAVKDGCNLIGEGTFKVIGNILENPELLK